MIAIPRDWQRRRAEAIEPKTKRGFMKKLILRFTHRLWNQRISILLCRAYERGNINSKQLHELAAMFDPTQKHEVY